MMILVQMAWETLRDDGSRAEYDRKLLIEQSWEGQCEIYHRSDIRIYLNTDPDIVAKHGSKVASVDCRCGTEVRLYKSHFLSGFSRVACHCCSLRIQFECTDIDFL